MFAPRVIGHISSPYRDTKQIPKGLHTKHDAEGMLNILPEFEVGLTDIEGFSHLFVLWVFDRAQGFDLIGSPPFEKDRTESSLHARPAGQTRSDSRWSAWYVAKVANCMCVVSTCSTGRRFLTSSPICRACPPKRCAADGWLKRRPGTFPTQAQTRVSSAAAVPYDS